MPALDQLQARLEQKLLRERIPIRDTTALSVAGLGEIFRSERRSVNSVSTGARAHGDDWIPDAFGLGADQIVLVQQPDAHRVDQWIIRVGAVEHDLASHRRNSDAVAVIPDSFDDSGKEIPYPRALKASEAQRVQHCDRPRPHREYIAKDTAHSGGRPLIWLDRRGMVVRFDLEGDGEPVADGDHPRVLARSLKDVRSLGRQRLQYGPRMLVRAVLAPQRAHDAELGERRRATAHRNESIVLQPCDPVLRNEGGGDCGI